MRRNIKHLERYRPVVGLCLSVRAAPLIAISNGNETDELRLYLTAYQPLHFWSFCLLPLLPLKSLHPSLHLLFTLSCRCVVLELILGVLAYRAAMPYSSMSPRRPRLILSLIAEIVDE
jgi:hypothetical protein